MASIPRLNRPQVRPTAEPARMPAPNLAERAGAALQQTAGELQAFGREVQRLDEIRVNEALADYASQANDLMAGEDGILSQQGTRAVEGLDPFRDKLTVTRGDIEARLSTENQRTLFAAQSRRYTDDADRRAGQHVQAETRRVDTASVDALNRTDMERIATEARQGADPRGIIRELDTRIALYGDRQGWSPEMMANARAEAVSTARTAQLTAMANTENEEVITRAREIFAEEQGSMTERDRQTVERTLEQAGTQSQAASHETRLVAQYPDDKAAALAEARKISDVKVRDATVNRLLARYAQDDAMERAANAATLEGVLEKLANSRGDLSVITPSERTRLERAGQMDNVELRARQLMNGSAPVTDLDALEELYGMDQRALAELDPNTYRARLDRNDYERLLGWVREARGGNTNPTNTAATVDRYTFREAVRLQLFSVQSPTELQGEEKAKYDEMRRKVSLEIDRQRADLKRDLTVLELEAAARTVLDTTVLDKGILGFSAPGRAIAPLGTDFRRTDVARPVVAPMVQPDTTKAQQWEALRREGLSAAEATRRLTNTGNTSGPAEPMVISPDSADPVADAVEFIAGHEQFRAEAYVDEIGTGKPLTVGYGQTGPDVTADTVTTEEDARQWLADRVRADAARLRADGVTPNAAILSFIYNAGYGRFRSIGALDAARRGNWPEVARLMSRITSGGGVTRPGLVRRRAEEAAMLAYLGNEGAP